MGRIEIAESRVIETRETKKGRIIHRRRQMPDGRRFTTIERVALFVSDEKGVTEDWDLDKLRSSIKEASFDRLTDEQTAEIIKESLSHLVPKRSGMQKRVISARSVAEAVFSALERVDVAAAICYGATYGVGIFNGNSSLDSISDWLEKRKQIR